MSNDTDEYKAKLINLLEGLEMQNCDDLIDNLSVDAYRELGRGYVSEVKKLIKNNKK